ncbi:MAG: zinc-dependent peptidase [Spirochaetia bacterium]
MTRLLGGRGRRGTSVEIPEELWQGAVEKHPICRGLSPEQLERLRTRTAEVRSRIAFDAVRGVADAEELRLSVALQAALPVLELGVEWYRAVRTILLVPHEYESERSDVDEAGVVHEGIDTISGELGPQAPVVLSVADVEASGWGEGYNVVIHEMAHVLDATNGELDGTPALRSAAAVDAWRESLTLAFTDHVRRVQRAERAHAAERMERGPAAGAGGAAGRRHREPPVVDSYGAEDREEFFACAVELFFERPRRLRRTYPQLYDQFLGFFGFDPAGSFPSQRRELD